MNFATPTPLVLNAAVPDKGRGYDVDPQETSEWRDAFQSLVEANGPERAVFMLDELRRLAVAAHIPWEPVAASPYVNTIAADQQAAFPGDMAIEQRLGAIMRWNALIMVMRANAAYGGLGGHIASYASAADLFEVGFNHFFHANDGSGHGGDLVFFQPHSAPGVYARAFLEGRLSEHDLAHFRQELSGPRRGARGLSSYPHPYLMPDFWQFPTGSMGIGPISSIYHARFMHYLTHRGLLDCTGRKVWGVFGDGEMDEPESTSALTLAAREGLDNLIWVVNCNLQRLDGPVRGNGRIIDELERLFCGAGWNVIKLLWGSDWDALFAQDITGVLARTLGDTVDGQMQTFAAKDGQYNRHAFFGQNDELSRLVRGMTDEEIDRLHRGGHDIVKIHAAYAAAARHTGQPTVILAHTKKGYGMGKAGQGRMTTHSHKKLNDTDLIQFRDRFKLPLTDEQALGLEFYKPSDDSPEMRYLHARRKSLGGYLPARLASAPCPSVPEPGQYGQFALKADNKSMSTTMALVRLLGGLLKDETLGPRVVPIVADEARTFGMANLFRQVGIYSSVGQRYEPEDIDSILSYREALDGQILEEGISEAGALSSWMAAATSYSVHGIAMLPFYIYYSMFGFQRVGDLIWAAADQRARGFLIGATSGRSTLGGEGLQHQDGNSHLAASGVPNCRAYDPAYAYELAVIVAHGMHRMLELQRDEFFYITAMNESYAQPSMPSGVETGIIKGMYCLGQYEPAAKPPRPPEPACRRVQLLGSGAILLEVNAAAQMLADDWHIGSRVYSVTSYSELARDARDTERHNRLHPGAASIQSHLQACLQDESPVVAVSDYVRAYAGLIAPYVRPRLIVLGTDGFGRSDTRQELRDHFEIDRHHIVLAALDALAEAGAIDRSRVAAAIDRYGIDPDRPASWNG